MNQDRWKISVVVGMGVFIIVLLLLRFHPSSKSVIVDFLSPFLVKKKNLEWQVKNRSTIQKSKIELLKQIEQLKQEIENLHLENRKLHNLKQENKELNRLLSLEGRPNYDYLPARIISRDPASGGRKVRLDRGILDGVKVGQAILVGGYLYGRILETSKHTSLVITILDQNCKISVKIANTNLHGILSGLEKEAWKISPFCIINFLPRDFEYQPGMMVRTSGYSTLIPDAIPIGVLAPNKEGKVTEIVDQLYKVANLKPLDLTEEFDYVTILMKRQ